MNRELIKAIILLPGTVLVLVPGLILLAGAGAGISFQMASPGHARFWAALVFTAAGSLLCIWTVVLFTKFGRGTPAPWEPPQRLVIRGPYRHVRNPMIIGVLLVLIGEAIALGSWPIAGWAVVFFIGNAIYFPLVEEKGLEKRFGSEYRDYRARVPRWVPRLRPWRSSDSG